MSFRCKNNITPITPITLHYSNYSLAKQAAEQAAQAAAQEAAAPGAARLRIGLATQAAQHRHNGAQAAAAH